MLKAYETSGDILFGEQQKFPAWIKILTVGILLVTTLIVLIAGLTGPIDQRGDMWISLAILIPVELLVFALFQNVTLEKVVTSKGIYFRWRPWQRKLRLIEKESIKAFKVRNTPPLHYGIGWFPGYGWIHNASLGSGMQLYLRGGKRIFFSTNDITLFSKAIESLIDPSIKTKMREF